MSEGSLGTDSCQEPRSSLQEDRDNFEGQAGVRGATPEKAEKSSMKAKSPQERRLSINLSKNMEVCVWSRPHHFSCRCYCQRCQCTTHFGGVALAPSKAGGPDVKNESNKHIAKFGHLKTGEAIVTNAGNLPCKKNNTYSGPSSSSKTYINRFLLL